jgi:hypothetical protein
MIPSPPPPLEEVGVCVGAALGVALGVDLGVDLGELEGLVTDGGAPSTFAGGVEAAGEVLLDLGLQRALLLLLRRRTLLAEIAPC